jgi:hypothetical protein
MRIMPVPTETPVFPAKPLEPWTSERARLVVCTVHVPATAAPPVVALTTAASVVAAFVDPSSETVSMSRSFERRASILVEKVENSVR